jgi:reactive intermediate/imine deaminase
MTFFFLEINDVLNYNKIALSASKKQRNNHMSQIIDTETAPAVIGSYSQAIKSGNTVYLSGQIPLDPESMTLVAGGIKAEVERVFENLKNVATAAGGNLNAITKLTVYLMDLSNITIVNEAIKKYFQTPYPARTSIQVAGLPKNSAVEIDAIMVL